MTKVAETTMRAENRRVRLGDDEVKKIPGVRYRGAAMGEKEVLPGACPPPPDSASQRGRSDPCPGVPASPGWGSLGPGLRAGCGGLCGGQLRTQSE